MKHSMKQTVKQWDLKGLALNTWKHRSLLLLAMPVIVLLIMFNYVPMFGSLVAFKEFNYIDGIWNSPWVGFKNFKFLFTMRDLTWRMIRNTVGYFILFTGIGTVANVALAIALNECRAKYFAKYSQAIMILPTFISYIAVSFIVEGFLDIDRGILNNLLTSMGRESIAWYQSAKYWPVIFVIIQVWKGTGYGSVLYLSALSGMDPGLFEAAEIEGATKWQQIRYITLPMLASMISIVTLMGLGSIMSSNTGLFYQVTRDSSMLYATTQTVDTFVLTSMVSGTGNFGPAAAVSFFQSVVGTVMVVGSNLVVRKFDPDSALF